MIQQRGKRQRTELSNKIRSSHTAIHRWKVVFVFVCFSGFNLSVAIFFVKQVRYVKLACDKCKLTLVWEGDLIALITALYVLCHRDSTAAKVILVIVFVRSNILSQNSKLSATVAAGCGTTYGRTLNSDSSKRPLFLIGSRTCFQNKQTCFTKIWLVQNKATITCAAEADSDWF